MGRGPGADCGVSGARYRPARHPLCGETLLGVRLAPGSPHHAALARDRGARRRGALPSALGGSWCRPAAISRADGHAAQRTPRRPARPT